MSDAKVQAALDQLEAWLADPSKVIESEEMLHWNKAYFAAVDGAERGPGWPQLVERAHGLGERLNVTLEAMIRERDAVRSELDAFARGSRALKGYGSNTR